ncbi:hypothetical protein KKG83_07055 [Candidatus Micrarchaeota archaeon]|nr:hypothetical protein [Candidatus Micrarchaeota archaeon]MBU2477201.1 hypothetical protein [Candidatus Micrarchaeota archaeon]
MKEKTRILAALTVIFMVSVVVVAFGKFLEKNSVEIAPEKAGYTIASDLMQTEKISLEKDNAQTAETSIKLSDNQKE